MMTRPPPWRVTLARPYSRAGYRAGQERCWQGKDRLSLYAPLTVIGTQSYRWARMRLRWPNSTVEPSSFLPIEPQTTSPLSLHCHPSRRAPFASLLSRQKWSHRALGRYFAEVRWSCCVGLLNFRPDPASICLCKRIHRSRMSDMYSFLNLGSKFSV